MLKLCDAKQTFVCTLKSDMLSPSRAILRKKREKYTTLFTWNVLSEEYSSFSSPLFRIYFIPFLCVSTIKEDIINDIKTNISYFNIIFEYILQNRYYCSCWEYSNGVKKKIPALIEFPFNGGYTDNE